MIPNYLNKLVEEARNEAKQMSLSELIKNAALNNVEIDDAIRDLRKSLNSGDVEATLVDDEVLMLTHRNEMKAHYEEKLQAQFEEQAAKVLEKANQLYVQHAGKPLSPEQKQELQQEVKQELQQGKAMTPFDNAFKPKSPYSLT